MTADEKKHRGAQPGNRSSVKGETPATSHLHIRIMSEEKAEFQAAAEAEGEKLSEWVLKHLRKAVKKRSK